MSFETALSGLNASSAELDITGNNIANSATVGFKQSRAEFSDVFQVTSQGTNATAIGSGVRLAAVSQQFTQGNIDFTDNNLDLAISGQGFYRLSDVGTIVFSRTGQFGVDTSGFIIDGQGRNLTGLTATNGVLGGTGNLQLSTANIQPNPTGGTAVAPGTGVSTIVNLDARAVAFDGDNTSPGFQPFNPTSTATYHSSTSATIYDSLGNNHVLTLYYRKTALADPVPAPLPAAPGTTEVSRWEVYAEVNPSAQAGAPDLALAGNLGASVYGIAGLMWFDGNGQLVGGSNFGAAGNTIGAPATLAWTPSDPSGVASGAGAGTNFIVDMANTTQFGSPFAVNALSQDGYTTGRLNGVDIDDGGVIQGRFSNGQSQIMGQVQLTNFSNPQGLQPTGNNAWAETFDSGLPLTGNPGSAELGLIQSGALEASNVDITEQLVNMITAQRNFQANAQVISTFDQITQTLLNIR